MTIVLVLMRKRVILRLYRLAPISPCMVSTSQLASSLVISLSTLLLQIALAKMIYKIQIAGSIGALLVMLIAGSLTFLAFGFIIASVAENAKTAQVMANLLFFPLM